jgi:serine-protein kinase ATM
MLANAGYSFDAVSPILLGREATIAAIKRSAPLRNHFKMSLHEAQLLEVRSVRDSLKIARSYAAAQFCLNRVMYLSKLTETPAFSSQKVEAAILHDTAHVLWDQGEASASIQMLRQLKGRDDLEQQVIAVSRAEVLADLGRQTAEARLSKPDEIIADYLLPAIAELHGNSEGVEAGRVFHNFAVFCDMQLQNTEDKEEFSRIEGMRKSKLDEIEGLAEMMRTADPKRKENLKKHHSSAKQWFKIDDDEYQRLKQIRERFIAQSLENYLRSMIASDAYSNDTLRFVALWLDQSESENAQAAVGKYLTSVSSRKFAPLMNQLFSRILNSDDSFQRSLTNLLYRVCCEHPYHSLYQLFAASKSKGAKNDVVANSRHTAAGKLADKVMKQSTIGNLWVALHNCSIAFVRLANEKLADQKIKSGSKLLLCSIENGRKVEQTVHDSSTKIPPPTMKVELRADLDYSSTPTILKFNPEISIAGGVSAPKIMTIIATDGSRHKILLKGGNDDLRQDSIMEQVFEQVSNLLKDHRTTRQRRLGIRTYKVLPLTPNAGIIEFVKDTIPLHEYLLPAHQKYYPKDWKPGKCRKDIADAQNKHLPQRVQAYRTVCANFRPVMRFFFMERFLEPDEWFQRRLAFSRSTAATSILGHVLGLGDRHGHNILLDEKTGEVVHIDLGVAFEAGRILPVPEVVPFRLTRDMVDGMGLSGVEGVFRRCCNFTLEALRQDQYSIMTVLDVLRYDPLYSWSMTPLRLQKMQDAQEAGRDGDVKIEDNHRSSTRGRAATPEEQKPKKNANEASEADRALTVVAKKLGKGLSVEATVNELIQQATDEKNLATLYCGCKCLDPFDNYRVFANMRTGAAYA